MTSSRWGGRRYLPYAFTEQGERPMSITWRLDHAMPAELFEEMKVAAGRWNSQSNKGGFRAGTF